MSAKATDRYFYVNFYLRKGGRLGVTSVELESHERATALAARAALDLLDLTGDIDEEIEVFVGSKAALDRHIAARGAR